MPDRHSHRYSARVRGLVFALSILLAFIAFPYTSARMQGASDDGTFNPQTKGGAPAEFVPGEALVRFRSGAQATRARLAHLNVRSSLGDEIPVTVEDVEGFEIVKDLRLAHVAPADTLKAIAALNERSDVLYAEPNYILHKEQATQTPNDASYGDLWGLKNTGQTGNNDVTGQLAPGIPGADIKAEQAWGNFTTGSRNVVVAVIDEGIDISHPDLQANIWTNPGEVPNDGVDNDGDGFVDDVHGWDFAHNDKTIFDNTSGVYPAPTSYTGDTDDHGTHVSGTIGAVGNNGQGVVGVNWQVSIMSVKVLAKGGGSTSNIIKGYNYVKLMKDRGVNVRVTNNSYGGVGFSPSSFDAISVLNDDGILLVAAAGNETENSAEFSHYPSDYNLPNVIPVAATDRFEQLAVFSNYGAQNILLAAPGRGTLSTTPFNTYSFFSGTSMATPHVTGAAALCLAAFPNVSIASLKNALVLSGDPLPSLNGKAYSQRRLNVYQALQTLAENDVTPPNPINDLHVVSQSGRSVTLGWTATGDDGNTGAAALYIIQADSTFLATKIPAPAGTPETVTVNVPYHLASTQLNVRVRDNAGFDVGGGAVTVNSDASAVEPYNVSLSANEALSTGGAALGVSGDDSFRESVALPFAFPFYGVNQTSVTVSSNGTLYFSKLQRATLSTGEIFGADAHSSVADLTRHKMIAGMWDDLQTEGNDVYMSQPDANRVIFRWQGRNFDNAQPVNFETELRSDGTIINRYGAGNTGLYPVVGISSGEPTPYVVSSHTSQRNLGGARINLTNAQTVTFAPTAPVNSTVTISGRVSELDGTTGFDNVTLTLSGSQNGTAQADASGYYRFQNLPAGGNYTVTPSKPGAAFTPSVATFNNLQQNKTADFAVARIRFTVSGRVQKSDGVGVSGATVSYDTGLAPVLFHIPRTTTTNSDGRFSFTGFIGENYWMSVGGVISNPALATIQNLSSDQTVVFVVRRPKISGHVRDGDGNFVSGASVYNGTQSVTSGADGAYQFTDLYATGNYTLTASKAGQFTSSTQTVNNLQDDVTVDFVVSPYITVTGRVKDSAGNPIYFAGVKLSTESFTRSGAGFDTYFTSISPTASTPITMSLVKYGYQFNPQSVTFTGTSGGNQVIDFVGTLGNQIDGSQFFVRQHYADFLNRQPDAAGGGFWTSGIEQCGSNIQCVEVKRIDTSAAFFLSIEFQQTGYLVYRTYKAAYGNIVGLPVPVRRAGFMSDTQAIGQNVVVGATGWEQQLETNKQAYFDSFVARPEFIAAHPQTLTTAQFVDALNLSAGGVLSPAERDALASSTLMRGQILRAVAEDADMAQREFNSAFVLMQYFGYLQRDPNAAPDTDYSGYRFWLAKLNEFGGDYRRAEMVKAFLSSSEYRARFGAQP